MEGHYILSAPRAALRSCVMRGRRPRRDAPMMTFASRFVFFSLSDRAGRVRQQGQRQKERQLQLQSHRLQLALSHNERQEGLEARAFRALPILCAKRLRLHFTITRISQYPNSINVTARFLRDGSRGVRFPCQSHPLYGGGEPLRFGNSPLGHQLRLPLRCT